MHVDEPLLIHKKDCEAQDQRAHRQSETMQRQQNHKLIKNTPIYQDFNVISLFSNVRSIFKASTVSELFSFFAGI